MSACNFYFIYLVGFFSLFLVFGSISLPPIPYFLADGYHISLVTAFNTFTAVTLICATRWNICLQQSWVFTHSCYYKLIFNYYFLRQIPISIFECPVFIYIRAYKKKWTNKSINKASIDSVSAMSEKQALICCPWIAVDKWNGHWCCQQRMNQLQFLFHTFVRARSHSFLDLNHELFYWLKFYKEM